ncbi:MAG: PRC-barrel domain-containing protein [Candidatus Aenigmarchaeota archaeon]|nr:PRC-barrel domain-containing protein [Candidatus Aenigmarchaeota archaeon]
MAIKVASVTETFGKDVFTDKGMYCGKIEDFECDLRKFKVRAVVVRAMKGSYLTNMLGNKKGLVVPFPMVSSIGDVVIIKHITAPVAEDVDDMPPGAD